MRLWATVSFAQIILGLLSREKSSPWINERIRNGFPRSLCNFVNVTSTVLWLWLFPIRMNKHVNWSFSPMKPLLLSWCVLLRKWLGLVGFYGNNDCHQLRMSAPVPHLRSLNYELIGCFFSYASFYTGHKFGIYWINIQQFFFVKLESHHG